MKKTFLLLAFLHIVTSSFCTNNTITKTYDFGAVKSIDAGSIYNIEVTEGKQKGVTIVCDPSLQEHLDVKYFHGELILSMKPNTKIVNGNSEGVKVYLQMETIEELDLSGAAKLKVDGQFKNNEMDMELSGASAAKISNLSGNSIGFGILSTALNTFVVKYTGRRAGHGKVGSLDPLKRLDTRLQLILQIIDLVAGNLAGIFNPGVFCSNHFIRMTSTCNPFIS
jgi:hypothetical protein